MIERNFEIFVSAISVYYLIHSLQQKKDLLHQIHNKCPYHKVFPDNRSQEVDQFKTAAMPPFHSPKYQGGFTMANSMGTVFHTV